MKLYLDDIRFPLLTYKKPEEWETIRNPLELFMVFCTNYKDITHISFDHDLNYYNENDEEITGYKCLQFICDFMLEKNIDPSNYIFYFHTANPVGKKNMQSYWNNFQRHYKENNLKDYTKKL